MSLLTCTFGRNEQTGNRVNQAKYKMRRRQPANVDHGAAQRRLDDSISHAHNEQQEKRKRVSSRIQYTDDDEQCFRAGICAVSVLEVLGNVSFG